MGSCRLVELARALVCEPVLLMADEPSSGLDIRETHELSNVLRMLQRERGMAMLLVEHDLGMVGEVVDRTVVMNLGMVIADGTLRRGHGRPRRPPGLPRGVGVTPSHEPVVAAADLVDKLGRDDGGPAADAGGRPSAATRRRHLGERPQHRRPGGRVHPPSRSTT